MATQRTSTNVVDLLLVVGAIGLFIARLVFAWGPVPSWIGMAFLVGLVFGRMMNRSPYRTDHGDLHLHTN